MSRFFIERPIFASVLSIVIVLTGLITLKALPVAQYPDVAPPTVQVTANYPGADARVLQETVATPIEQEVNGVEDMLYMQSTCSADGKYTLTVTFKTGVNLDMANVLVQNRVATAMAKLPEEVKRLGVTTKKKSPDFAMMISLVSPGGRFDDIYLSNYATRHLKDRLARVQGVGDVMIFGAAEYSMRVWLDPRKLMARDLTTNDLVAAIREQNVQVAAGAIGRPPAPAGQAFQLTVTTLGRLADVEQFENIIVKTGEKGQLTRVKDVARVELGAENYTMISELNGSPCVTIAVFQLPGANLLEISEEARGVLEELSRSFPHDVDCIVAYDASAVVTASIDEIIETLLIAALLVILTVWIFLQDIRATLIPTITIPVSLIGTFAVMGLLGFSLNSLTLFGLVLAIGIVVDDAIVVVENVSRNIDEGGLDPKAATILAMKEVTGPVIATTLVLLAVFVPTAFMGGFTGVLYNQFGLTIATTTVFSSINALTMSPALCALLLRRSPEKRNFFFRGFNALLGGATAVYGKTVGLIVRKAILAVVLFGGVMVGAYYGFVETPTGFVPPEDQGYLMVNIQLPDGASMERTLAVQKRVSEIIAETPNVANNIAIGGYSFIDSSANSNVAAHIVVLTHWDDRDPRSMITMLQHFAKEFGKIQEAVIVAFPTPPLPGLGLVSGFDMQVQDLGVGLSTLSQATEDLAGAAEGQASTQGLYTSFRANVPQLFVDVDREKVKRLGIPLQHVFDALQAFLGSAYVNDFNKFGRTYRVNVQADAQFRATEKDIRRLRVRNNRGEMIPLGTLLEVQESFGPPLVTRYNMHPAASLKGQPAPGFSSGDALNTMEQLATSRLPLSMGYEWTGISYQEKQSGSQAGLIFGLAVVFVYLVLAAQYEAWGIPWAVILAVPMGVLGAMAGTLARGYDNNVYTQIGLVLLVGLVSKNAILIVEFAREKRAAGMSVVEASLTAARLRFRPILMTALSFVLGTIPLVIATGAGGGSRRALGTAVFSGMIVATFLGVLLTPALYRIIQGTSEAFRKKESTES